MSRGGYGWHCLVALGMLMGSLTGCARLGDVLQRPFESKAQPQRPASSAYTLAKSFSLGYEPNAMAVSRSGALVATTAVAAPFIDVWDASAGIRKVRLVGHRLPPVTALQFRDDGDVLVSGGGRYEPGLPEPSVRVWDVATGRMLDVIPNAQTASIVGVAISPDGHRIVAASTDSLRQWKRSSEPVADGMWVDHTSPICGLSVSRDLGVIASGGLDQRVLLRHAAAMNTFTPLLGHEAGPCGLQFEPDGRTLVSWDFGSESSTIRVWEVARAASIGQVKIKGRVLAVFFRGSIPVAAIRGAVLRVDQQVAPAIPDYVSLISLPEGRDFGELAVTPKFLEATPNGDILVAGSWDGVVSVFHQAGAR